MIEQTFIFYNLTKNMRYCLKHGMNSKIKRIKITQIFGIDICMSIEMNFLYKTQKCL